MKLCEKKKIEKLLTLFDVRCEMVKIEAFRLVIDKKFRVQNFGNFTN